MPLYEGLTVGVPSVPDLVETLADGRYDLVHVVSPGPAGVAAALTARIGGMPLVGSYHTELAAYVRLRSGDPVLEASDADGGLGLLRPVPASCSRRARRPTQSLLELGIEPERIGRWARGVDLVAVRPGACATRAPIRARSRCSTPGG